MTTTPLPEKQYQIGGKGHSDEAMQAYAAQARADLEAENKRLRKLLERMVVMLDANYHLIPHGTLHEDARAALKETP